MISIRPLYVHSNMVPDKGSIVINRNQCAKGSLNKLGIDNCSSGHWFHRLQNYILSMIPLRIRYKKIKYAKR